MLSKLRRLNRKLRDPEDLEALAEPIERPDLITLKRAQELLYVPVDVKKRQEWNTMIERVDGEAERQNKSLRENLDRTARRRPYRAELKAVAGEPIVIENEFFVTENPREFVHTPATSEYVKKEIERIEDQRMSFEFHFDRPLDQTKKNEIIRVINALVSPKR